MEHVEYVFTFGMDEDETATRLYKNDTGVLALTEGAEAYAIPVDYDFDGTRLLIRLAKHPDSTKVEYLEETDRVTFVIYDPDDPDGAWSILVRGPLVELPEESYDDTEINERFGPLILFGESVDETTPAIYELEIEELTGHRVK